MAARILTVAPRECPEEVVAQARRLLHSGGLVALPTETVYGVAALADGGEGEAKLATLKRRERGKPFTIHIADPEEATRWAAPLPRCARRLARRYWPGPLTLVAAGAAKGTVGLRLPSRLITRAVLRAAGDGRAPLVMTSANRPGAPPAATAEEVVRTLGEEVDLVIDGGRAELGEPSTLVRAVRPRLDLLRPGALTRREIELTGCSLVLFVCSGNTCRSPMAADLARRLAAEAAGLKAAEYTRSGLLFASAGVGALPGLPATKEARLAVAAEGGDLTAHRSSPLDRRSLELARFVLCLAAHHRERVLSLAGPTWQGRVEMLLPGGEDVPDPIGGGVEVYEKTRDRIKEGLAARMEALLADPWQPEEE